jgi:hypothetical protein
MSNATTPRTQYQIDRDETRSESTGRFTKLNPCEVCDKSAGANYYSDDRCNTTGFGLCLCKRCAKKLGQMTDSEYLAVFQAR